jgi:hypothetical protein
MLCCCVLAVAVARGPLLFMPRPFGDEAFFALVGHHWLNGKLPYTAIWDVKPPGLFALYAITEWITGSYSRALRFLPQIMALIATLALCKLGRTWFNDTVATVAAVLYAGYSIVLTGALGRAEILLEPFVVIGFLLVGTGGLRAALMSGICFGVAFTIKQTAAFDALMAAAILLTRMFGRRELVRMLAAFGAGGLLPLLGFAALFAVHGQFAALWDAAIVEALLRTKSDGISLVDGALRIAPSLKPVLPLLLLALLSLAERRRILRTDLRKAYLWSWGWTLAALLGLVAGRALYAHYFLTLLPSMALTAALYVDETCSRLRLRTSLSAAIAAAMLAYPLVWVSTNNEWPLGDRNVDAIVGRLLHAGVVPGTDAPELFVVDNEPAIYLATDTLPPSKYMLQHFLECDFPLPNGDKAEYEIDRIFDKRPRFVLVSDHVGEMVCSRQDRVHRLMEDLQSGYLEAKGDTSNHSAPNCTAGKQIRPAWGGIDLTVAPSGQEKKIASTPAIGAACAPVMRSIVL